MPKLKTYEAEKNIIAPTDRGYQAAMTSGRRISQIMRQGTADLKAGIASIGSGLEKSDARIERRNAKAERDAERAENREERAQNKAERLQAKEEARAKAADKVKGQFEAAEGGVARADFKNQLLRERDSILNSNLKSSEKIAALDRWSSTLPERFQKFNSEHFTSQTGQMKGMEWANHDYNELRNGSRAAQAREINNGIVLGLAGTANSLASRLKDHPEELPRVIEEFRQSSNGVIENTPKVAPEGQMGGKTLPIGEPGEAGKAFFRTLEGNTSGKGDNAISPKGAGGRYQLTEGFALQHGFAVTKDQLANDVDLNEKVFAKGYDHLSRKYNGDPEAMAIAYHNGESVADKWVKGGRDDSILQKSGGWGPESESYLARARGLGGEAGASAGVTFETPQSKVQKFVETTNNRLTVYAIHSAIKSGHLDVAEKMMNDPQFSQHLTPKDLDPINGIPKAIENGRRIATNNGLHQQYAEDVSSKALSSQSAISFAKEMLDQNGKFKGAPADWTKRVQDAQEKGDLRAEDAKALIGAHERLGKLYSTTNEPGMIGRAFGQQTTTEFKREGASDPDTVNGIVGSFAPKQDPKDPNKQKGPATAAEILSHVGLPGNTNPDAPVAKSSTLTLQDSIGLMSYTNPANPAYADAPSKLAEAMKKAHDTLAPPNPDGSRNEAGEAAYHKFLGETLPKYWMASFNGSPLSAFDPKAPESAMWSDANVQKYAPSHEALVKKPMQAQSFDAMPDTMGLQQEYNDEYHGKAKAESYDQWRVRKHPESLGATAGPQHPLSQIFQPEDITGNLDQRPISEPTGAPAPEMADAGDTNE